MIAAVVLIAVAMVMRRCGAILRAPKGKGHWTFHLVGWLLCMIAVFIAVGAAGGFSPIWPALVVAAAGLLVEFKWRGRTTRAIADAALVAFCGFLSVPPLGTGLIVLLMAAASAAGYMVDYSCNKEPLYTRVAVLVVLLGAGLAGLVARFDLAKDFYTLISRNPLQLGVTVVREVEPIKLATGAAAWVEKPDRSDSAPAAVFFHGADAAGPAAADACQVRRALLHAGFTVISVHEAGYGGTPAPGVDAPVEDWDPLPTALSAVGMARALYGVTGVLAIGHSQGSDIVLALAGSKAELAGAVLSGCGFKDLDEREDYWFNKFHSSRRLDPPLDRDKWREIQHRFFDPRTLAEKLTSDHVPILMFRAERDGARIRETRDGLYDLLPGVKSRWDLPDATHSFNAAVEFGVLLGDTRVPRMIAARLNRFGAGADQ